MAISFEKLSALVDDRKSTRQIGTELGCGQTSVRWWLKKYGLRTRPKTISPTDLCNLCGEVSLKSYQARPRTMCPPCTVRVRRYRMKAAAVERLGGKCTACGWSGPIAGYDFHHLRDKKFTIGRSANKSWDSVVEEIDKCKLLCSTCHSIKHARDADPKFLAIVREYKGRLFS